MPNYIINKIKDNNGNNEVHNTSCSHLPLIYNQVSLGWYSDAKSAVVSAKNGGWTDADGCYYCCKEAHNG